MTETYSVTKSEPVPETYPAAQPEPPKEYVYEEKETEKPKEVYEKEYTEAPPQEPKYYEKEEEKYGKPEYKPYEKPSYEPEYKPYEKPSYEPHNSYPETGYKDPESYHPVPYGVKHVSGTTYKTGHYLKPKTYYSHPRHYRNRYRKPSYVPKILSYVPKKPSYVPKIAFYSQPAFYYPPIPKVPTLKKTPPPIDLLKLVPSIKLPGTHDIQGVLDQLTKPVISLNMPHKFDLMALGSDRVRSKSMSPPKLGSIAPIGPSVDIIKHIPVALSKFGSSNLIDSISDLVKPKKEAGHVDKGMGGHSHHHHHAHSYKLYSKKPKKIVTAIPLKKGPFYGHIVIEDYPFGRPANGPHDDGGEPELGCNELDYYIHSRPVPAALVKGDGALLKY